MNREDQEIAEMIATLRQTEPDDRHGVSIERAMKTGRRKVYTRRSVGVLTAMAAVVAVSVASTAISNQFTSELQPAARYDRFDVWTQEFTIGSAGGFTPTTYETGEHEQFIYLRPADQNGPLKLAQASVNLWPAGRPFEFNGTTDPPEPMAAPPAAPGLRLYKPLRYRNVMASEESLVLPWQWTDGGWGFVSLYVPSGGYDQLLSRAIHIVESIRPDAGRRIAVPFTIDSSQVPIKTIAGVVMTKTPNGRQDISLRLAAGSPEQQSERYATVGVHVTGRAGVPNSTINGRPAVQTEWRVTIPNIGNGFDAVASVGPAGSAEAQGKLNWCRTMAAGIRLVANPLNEKNWTDDPIR